ncbi:MAG: ATP-grasp domain-containing protein [Candidatus Pacebacteria bacterium]|nr:ATP-grasp domain-containing protein [Candidatus Paceibacterota bacterium]
MLNNSKTYLVIGYSKPDHVKSVFQQGHRLFLFVSRQQFLKYHPERQDYFSKIMVFADIYQWRELKEQLDSLPRIDAVITRYDHFVNVLGVINEYLGLEGLDYQATKNFSNKFLMKQCFQQGQVSCADGICFDKVENSDLFLTNHDFPLIIKTTTGTHSRFVFKAKSIDELHCRRRQILTEVPDELSSQTVKGFRAGQECQVLVEEILTGREVSVDTFISNGNFIHTPICEYVLADSLNVDDSYLPIRTMPAQFNTNVQQRVYDIVEQALASLSANFCVCHTELFVDEEKDKISVVETTPRGGGNRAEMTQIVTGFNYNLAVFKAATGQLETRDLSAAAAAVSVVEYFAPEDGIIESINLSFLNKNPQVSYVKVRNNSGDKVKQARHGGKSIVSFFVKADSPQESESLAKTLFKQVQKAVAVIGGSS